MNNLFNKKMKRISEIIEENELFYTVEDTNLEMVNILKSCKEKDIDFIFSNKEILTSICKKLSISLEKQNIKGASQIKHFVATIIEVLFLFVEENNCNIVFNPAILIENLNNKNLSKIKNSVDKNTYIYLKLENSLNILKDEDLFKELKNNLLEISESFNFKKLNCALSDYSLKCKVTNF
jgi:transcriptional regulator